MDIKKDFIQRLRGRAEFCRDRGEVKTPELLEQAAQLLEEKAQAVPEGFGDIQSWIAVNSFSALDASIVDFPVVDANELAEFIDSLELSVSISEGFVLVEIKDLRDVISNAGDAMMNEETSSVYDRTGEPSTWFDHYTLAEKRVLKAIEAQEQKG